jgi:hypothetical protein
VCAVAKSIFTEVIQRLFLAAEAESEPPQKWRFSLLTVRFPVQYWAAVGKGNSALGRNGLNQESQCSRSQFTKSQCIRKLTHDDRINSASI